MIINEEVYLDSQVSSFFEHHGIRGMRWGVRRAQTHKVGSVEKAGQRAIRKARSNAATNAYRPGKQTAAIIGVGFVSWMLGGAIAGAIAPAAPLAVKIPLSYATAAATTVAGVKFTQRYFDKHNALKTTEIQK